MRRVRVGRTVQRVGRWATVFLAALAVTGAVTAAPAFGAAKKVQVRFWNVWDLTREPLMNKVIEEFERRYPDIDVVNEVIPCCDIATKALTAMAAGTAPQVLMLQKADIISLADKGAFIPLTPYVKKFGVDLNEFYKAEVEAFLWDGELWALPMPTVSGNDDMYIYNKDLFDEVGLDASNPPRTWTAFEAAQKKLTQLSADGKLERMGLGIYNTQFFHLLYSNAGAVLSPDKKKVTVNTPEAIAALEYMVRRLNQINQGTGVQQQFDSTVGAPGSSPNHPFYRGLLAMIHENVSIFGTLRNFAKELNYGVMRVPYNERNPKAQSTGVAGTFFGWGYVIPAGTKPEVAEAAARFITFLTMDEKATGFFMLEQARPSPIRRFNTNPKYFELNKDWRGVIQALDTDEAFPTIPVQKQIVDIILTKVNDALLLGKPVKQALDEANREAQKVVDDYWKQRK